MLQSKDLHLNVPECMYLFKKVSIERKIKTLSHKPVCKQSDT